MLVCSAAGLSAQLAREIAVFHRSGQTFVTWREARTSGVRYRVHRSGAPIRSAAELALADHLGEVDDRSSRNEERSRVERAERNWILAPGGLPLAFDQGLFVHTAAGEGAAFYAVTAVRNGVEELLVTPGRNATTLALSELAAPPQPVLQARTAVRETWGHWVSDRDTPFQPAMSLTPSHGFDFAYEPGIRPRPHGLLLRLHPAGGTYAEGWPTRGMVPGDMDVLAPSDLHPTTGYTFWLGAHERFPAAPAQDTAVWPFTQARVLWTLGWLQARLGVLLDPERVSLAGSSLGATGGMYLLEERPELFAAALLRNGNYDLLAGDYDDARPYELLFGSFAFPLPMRAGLSVLARTNASHMAHLAPSADWPVIRTLNGRQDTRVGWRSAVSLFAGLAETQRPAAHYFDDRAHTAQGYWAPLEGALIRRTCQARRNRPSLHFGACSLDDDPGDGSRASGTTIGALGGRVDYDPLTALSSATRVRFDVFLRAEGALDDALVPEALAVLTPRRTGAFTPVPGEPVRFTLGEGGAMVAEHWLVADALGLVHTPPIPLTAARRQAVFER